MTWMECLPVTARLCLPILSQWHVGKIISCCYSLYPRGHKESDCDSVHRLLTAGGGVTLAPEVRVICSVVFIFLSCRGDLQRGLFRHTIYAVWSREQRLRSHQWCGSNLYNFCSANLNRDTSSDIVCYKQRRRRPLFLRKITAELCHTAIIINVTQNQFLQCAMYWTIPARN